MPRLYRPHIPISVKVAVAERQFKVCFPDLAGYSVLTVGTLSHRLKVLLANIAAKFGCEVKDLRLDHDPPLALRQRVPVRRPVPNHRWFNQFGVAMRYEPDANDPEHLVYRPHGGEFEGSHDIKTRVRGDHGQFSDLALIRREKRRQKKAVKKSRPMNRKAKFSWPSRPFAKRRK